MAHGLSIRRLEKSYIAGKPVLHGINLDIGQHEVVAIIGPSGTGKSTLIRCINRLVQPTAGEIWFQGQDLLTLSRRGLREARRQIGMVFQEYNLVERLTVMENILCGRLGYMSAWSAWWRRYHPQDIEQAFALLEQVGLSGLEHQRADSLSGGQRQRVGIARAVMQHPKLLLADEPTSSLDPKTSVEVMQILVDMGQQLQIPIVINMHDVVLAQKFASRIIGMSGGSIVYDGAPGGLSESMLQAIYGGETWLH
ncbi:MAG: phosphonate ABC transporter ATP-binding protein [Hylemonella sp.]|jgi:phosphonate transport system ATP-binding protein